MYCLEISVLCFQDQDSLLVKRRNDNHSLSLALTREVNLATKSSASSADGDQRIWEGIPIPDSLGEEYPPCHCKCVVYILTCLYRP